MDLLLGFESLDNDPSLPIYTTHRTFDANSLDFHRSCSDPVVRPILNEGHGDGGIWMDASSCISQSSWQQHDPFLYSFAFDDILLAEELQQSPENTITTMFTANSEATDSPDSGNGKRQGNHPSYLSVDSEREWSNYIPASLSSPMRALEFFQNNHTSLALPTNELFPSTSACTSNATGTLTISEGNPQNERSTMGPSFVNLRLVESQGLQTNPMPSGICNQLLDFEVPPFILPDGLVPFGPTPTPQLLPDILQAHSNTLPGGDFKPASLHGWSDHDASQFSERVKRPTLNSMSKPFSEKHKRSPIHPHVFIPIKPPTRSTTHIRPSPRIKTTQPDAPKQAQVAPVSIPEAARLTHETDTQQSLRSSESDDYLPSPSPSLSAVRSSSPVSVFHASPPPRRAPKAPARRKARRGRGKAKGSAALALAVVTQLGTAPNDDVDPVTLYQEGKIDMLGIRKRKNHPIPLPIPVPNLNKKSRGRKVPYVAPGAEGGQGEESEPSPDYAYFDIGETEIAEPPSLSTTTSMEGDSYGVSTRSRRRGSVSSTAPLDPLADKRTYVCDVAGCGKCFVRGEHLKRHIRSIHTYEKPHTCPYDGCDKSFSRRDNLGQHVRIHLQP